MRFSVLFCLVGMLMMGLSPVAARLQDQILTDSVEGIRLVAEFERRMADGDCAYLDEFTSKHLGTSDFAGLIAQFYAFDSLLERSPDRGACRYHDRKASLRAAIKLYESVAEAA